MKVTLLLMLQTLRIAIPYLFAASGGEVSCLDARTGDVVWHNPLKGFGRGLACFAHDDEIGAAAAAIAAAQAAAMAAAAANAH